MGAKVVEVIQTPPPVRPATPLSERSQLLLNGACTARSLDPTAESHLHAGRSLRSAVSVYDKSGLYGPTVLGPAASIPTPGFPPRGAP